MLRHDHTARSAAETAAKGLVLHAIEADETRPTTGRRGDVATAQELPTLDLIGAAIARAARIAAAEDRARLHLPSI
ncbi:MAG: hypothetical protein ACKO3W_12485, partial [bacterium]